MVLWIYVKLVKLVRSWHQIVLSLEHLFHEFCQVIFLETWRELCVFLENVVHPILIFEQKLVQRHAISDMLSCRFDGTCFGNILFKICVNYNLKRQRRIHCWVSWSSYSHNVLDEFGSIECSFETLLFLVPACSNVLDFQLLNFNRQL